MDICFLVELPLGMWQWDDGLRGAMRIIEKDHHVCYHLDGELHEHKPDVLFCWGGLLAKTYREGLSFKGKKALFFAGGQLPDHQSFDMFFFENEFHTNQAKAKGIQCVTAFGTDTTIFKPLEQPKVFDVIYPGAFGLWKRKDLFAQAVKGLSALTLGNIQPHEMQCYDVCVENGIAVSADIPQSRLPYFYAMSKTTMVLPVSHIGGQRTVLESMAMKIPVIVPSDAPLVVEYAIHGGMVVDPTPEELRFAVLNPTGDTNKAYRFVLDNFTHEHYAQKIKEAIL